MLSLLVNSSHDMSKSSAKHHLNNGCFRNNAELSSSHTSIFNVLKWQLNRPKVPAIEQPIVDEDWHQLHMENPDSQLVWIGHATFLIQHLGLTMLTDPVFSDRASPVQFAGPKRTTQAAISIAELPHIDVVIVSHDHYDHLDRDSVLTLWQKQKDQPPMFVVPLKLGRWLSKLGIDNWVELDWWQTADYQGWTFTAVPVQHFSGRGIVQNKTLWAGWVMEAPAESEDEQGKRFFFAGDTGYSDDFNNIGKRFGEFDVSLIPIGAYEPRWFMRDVHVNPEEAVKIHLDVNSKFSVAMHWGSFILTDEPMDQPPKDLAQAKAKYQVPAGSFITVEHGEVLPLADIW